MSGLLVGDILTSINGKSVRTHQEAIGAIDGAGTLSAILVIALGGTREVKVGKHWSLGRVGLSMSNDESGRGVVVSALEAGSQAERSGLHVGDVVLSIDGKLCTTEHEAMSLLDCPAEGDALRLVLLGETVEHQLDKRAGDIGLTIGSFDER